jgi:hypothetical protein
MLLVRNEANIVRLHYKFSPVRPFLVWQRIMLFRSQGKGHETYQIFKDTVKPFDDREVVKQLLQ